MLSSSAGARLSGSLPQKFNSAIPPSGEMLYGAKAIANFLFGNAKYARRVYHLIEKNRLPVVRLPGLAARESTLLYWLFQQELASTTSPAQEGQ